MDLCNNTKDKPPSRPFPPTPTHPIFLPILSPHHIARICPQKAQADICSYLCSEKSSKNNLLSSLYADTIVNHSSRVMADGLSFLHQTISLWLSLMISRDINFILSHRPPLYQRLVVVQWRSSFAVYCTVCKDCALVQFYQCHAYWYSAW